MAGCASPWTFRANFPPDQARHLSCRPAGCFLRPGDIGQFGVWGARIREQSDAFGGDAGTYLQRFAGPIRPARGYRGRRGPVAVWRPSLLRRAAPQGAQDDGVQERHKEDDEKHLCYSCRRTRNAAKAKGG